MTETSDLLLRLQALSNPVRLWIIAELHRNGPKYVSELARAANISRPLLKMHLRKLEDAALVTNETGTAKNGKSANFFSVVAFSLPLSPDVIAQTRPVPKSLANQKDESKNARK